MTQSIEQLRLKAAKAGLYAIEERTGVWGCLRKADNYCLTVGMTEEMAIRSGLQKARVKQLQIDM